MLLRVREVHKSFDEQPILRGVSFEVARGEVIVLLGPSGCGKTTLLRIIAGLEVADQGRLMLEGADLEQIPIHKRQFGMVFQDFALFPHKNVKENVGFSLRMLGWDQPRLDDRVGQVLILVGLAEFGDRAVHELSGGEQQRVALARALAPFPKLLLLDEPLGSLDRALRERLMGELRSILKVAGRATTFSGPMTANEAVENKTSTPGDQAPATKSAITSIYVTHDQEEAFAIADRVLVMNEGRIEQEGSPVQLYRRPESPFVARFLGMENLLDVEIVTLDPPTVSSIIGDLRLSEVTGRPGDRATLLIRPEAANLAAEGDEDLNVIVARLGDISFRGRHQIVTVHVMTDAGSIPLKLNFDSMVTLPRPSSDINLRLDPGTLHILAR